MKKLLAFIPVLLFMTSCAKFSDGTSTWSAGAWLLAVPFAILTVMFMVFAFKAADSGSKINPIYGGGEGGNIPWYKTGWPVMAGISLLIEIAIVIAKNLEV